MLHNDQLSVGGAHVTQWPGICPRGTCYTMARYLLGEHMLHNGQVSVYKHYLHNREEKNKMRKQTVANVMIGFYTIQWPKTDCFLKKFFRPIVQFG